MVHAPGIADHKPADNRQYHNKHHRYIEIGARSAKRLTNTLLHPGAIEHPGFRRDPQHKTQFDVHLTIFMTFDGTNQGLGELVRHIGRHRHDGGNPHRHHCRGQHKGAT